MNTRKMPGEYKSLLILPPGMYGVWTGPVHNYDRFPLLIINSNSPPPLALFVRIYRAIGLEMLASYWLPLQPISVGLGLPPLFHIPSVATKPTGLLPAAA